MSRILLYEPIHKRGIETLNHAGYEWSVTDTLDEQSVCEAVASMDGLIVRAQGEVTATIMDAAPNLQVIGRHGVGVNHIDLEAATLRGIQVVNTPQANTCAVAEAVIGWVVTLSRRLTEADRHLRNGDWNSRERIIGNNLSGKTLGLIGYGRIGQHVAKIAFAGFGMTVCFYDEQVIHCNHKQLMLDEVLQTADIISIHLPLTPQTQGLLTKQKIEQIKYGALLVNASRGGIIDESFVAEMLHNGQLGGAAFDVFEPEPILSNNPLLHTPNTMLSPHMAAHSEEAVIAMAMVAEDVINVLEGKPPNYPVNDLA